jgi:hypothetical protein
MKVRRAYIHFSEHTVVGVMRTLYVFFDVGLRLKTRRQAGITSEEVACTAKHAENVSNQ